MELFAIGFFLFSIGMVYALPTIVAFSRRHPNSGAILLINILLGFTVLGWVIALIWATQGGSSLSAGAIASVLPPGGPDDSLGFKLARAKIETLRDRLEQARAEIKQRFDQIEIEVVKLERELSEGQEATTEGSLLEGAIPKEAPSLESAVASPSLEQPSLGETPGAHPEEQPKAALDVLTLPSNEVPIEAAPEMATPLPEKPLEVGTSAASPPEVAREEPVETPSGLAPPEPVAPAPELETPFTRSVEATEEALSGARELVAPKPVIPLSKIDWEALIGGSWLNIIGIVVLILGMVLLTEYSLRQFGPLGRVATGVAASLILLLSGFVLERMDRYTIFARTLLGGGWALLYFMAYAAHNVPAARVISDPAAGLLLMVGVAAGMILHSLKFRSQLLTGLAYGLGFFAVALTPVTINSLIACAILAASQLAIIRRFAWQTLALVAVAGTYLNHWRWLDQILASGAARSGEVTAADHSNYWLSLAIIGFYWLLFVISSLLRQPENKREKFAQLTVSVANTIGMSSVSALQILAFHSTDLYLLAGAATAAYAGAAYASWLARRIDLFRFNSSVAAVLYAVTLPLALGPLDIARGWLSVYWLFGGVAALAIGYAVGEALLRLEAYLLFGAVFLTVFNIVLPGLPADWRNASWWFAPVIAGAFLAVSDRLTRIVGRGGVLQEESEFLAPLWGYGGATVLALFLHRIATPELLGLSLGAAGLALFEIGADFSRFHLRGQGYLLLLLAAAQLVATSLGAGEPGEQHVSLWTSVAPGAPAFYYVYSRLSRERPKPDFYFLDWLSGQGASSAAALIFAILLWRQCDPSLVALAWLAFALALFEFGAWSERGVLRLHAYMLFAASLWALVLINLQEPASASLAPRWASVSAAAGVYYYLFWRLIAGDKKHWRTETEFQLSNLPSFAGSGLLVLLAWREVDQALVALVWLFFAIALFETGAWTGRGALRLQSYILSAASFVGLLGINLQQPALASPAPRWLIVGVAAGVYYFLYWRLNGGGAASWVTEAEKAIGDLPSFAGSTLLAVLAWREVDNAFSPLVWLALALTLFEIGAWRARGSLRLQAYVLSAAALFVLLTMHLYEIYPLDRAEPLTGTLRSVLVSTAALAYYYLFFRLNAGGKWRLLAESQRAAAPSLAGTALLAILIWKEGAPTSVAVAWATMALMLFEVGRARGYRQIELQGHSMAAVTFGRLLMANFVATDEVTAGGLSHRVLTVLPVAALFYYLRAQTGERAMASRPFTTGQLSRLYSWGGALLLVALARFELGLADWIMGLAALILALVAAGHMLRDKDFRYQSYLLAVVAFARVWSTNVYLIGGFYGLPDYVSERLVTMLPLLLGYMGSWAICIRFPRDSEADGKNVIIRALQAFDAHADEAFAFLSAALCGVIVYCEAPEGWVTSAWALEALLLIVVGFGVSKRSYRYCGLLLLLVCLLKLAVVDLEGVEPLARILSYIALGVILLLASFVYTRHRNVLKKYM